MRNRGTICTAYIEACRSVPRARVIELCFATAAVFLFLLQSVAAQSEFRPAATLFNHGYLAEIGKPAPNPETATARLISRDVSSCRATCDAFVPRQPVLTVTWVNEAVGTEVTPSRAGADARMRLDISGTASGFSEGNFSTIRLSNIPAVDEVVLDPASPIPAAAGEVLLNRVEANRVVERSGEMPIFESPNMMDRAMGELPDNLRAALDVDKRAGALGQVRVLGRAVTPLRGVSQQVVTMLGLQPGTTYRLRLVDEQERGAESIFEQICRIPVCPADFMDPEQ